jgi:hypothetical protein
MRTSETLVNSYQTTRHWNPENSHLPTHRLENLKSYLILLPYSQEPSPTLYQMNPVHVLPPYLHKIYFNIITHLLLGFTSGVFSSGSQEGRISMELIHGPFYSTGSTPFSHLSTLSFIFQFTENILSFLRDSRSLKYAQHSVETIGSTNSCLQCCHPYAVNISFCAFTQLSVI